MRYGTILAASLAVLALIILTVAVLTQPPDMSAASLAGWAMLATVVAAFVLSFVVLAQLFERLIEPSCTKWLVLDAKEKKRGRVGAYVGAVGVLPVTLFLAIVVGGNFGGAMGGYVSPSFGPVIGVGVGIFVITLFVSALGAVVGFLIAGYMAKRFQ